MQTHTRCVGGGGRSYEVGGAQPDYQLKELRNRQNRQRVQL